MGNGGDEGGRWLRRLVRDGMEQEFGEEGEIKGDVREKVQGRKMGKMGKLLIKYFL